MRGTAETLQADLIEMPNDRNLKYCLIVIDIVSKVAYVRPLKTEAGEEVTKAMKSVLFSVGRFVKNLCVDMGKEFRNIYMTKLMDEY